MSEHEEARPVFRILAGGLAVLFVGLGFVFFESVSDWLALGWIGFGLLLAYVAWSGKSPFWS